MVFPRFFFLSLLNAARCPKCMKIFFGINWIALYTVHACIGFV